MDRKETEFAGGHDRKGAPGGDIPTEWFWETDSGHCFTYISGQSSLATGLSWTEVIGRRREEFAADLDDPKWQAHFADLDAQRPFFRFEYAMKSANGGIFHISASGEPRFDDRGRFLGYRGAAADITQRNRAERELREARDMFRAVLDHAPVGIVLKDRDGHYLEVSREWQRRFGLSRDDVVGKTSGDVLPEDVGNRYMARDTRVAGSGRAEANEEKFERPDGSVDYYLTSCFPIMGPGGEVSALGMISADLTAHKQAELALEESEQQLRTVTDNLPALIARHDRDWGYRFINSEGARWYGMRCEDIVGKRIQDILPAKTCEEIRPMIESVLSGKPAAFSGTIGYPDGKRREVLINYVPDRAPDGSVQGWFAISHDVTEAQAVAQALRVSEEERRTVIENLPVLMARLDRDWRYRYINSEGARWYGMAVDEVVGKTIPELFGEETVAGIRPYVEAALRGEPGSFATTIPYPDGRTRNTEIDFVPDRAPDGTVQGWIALAQDTTARENAQAALRESESQMRTVADNLPVFIAYMDADMRYRFVNRTVGNWYGVGGDEIIGRRVSDLVLPETFAALLPKMRQVLAGQEVSFEADLAYPDNMTRTVQVTWLPDQDETGATRGWFSLIQDISVRKRLEAELVRRERLAVMGQLTGTVAHEIRNPLGAVATSIAALRKRTAGLEVNLDLERSLARAERGISRCERIVTELLDFARAKGRQPVPTDPGALIASIVQEQEAPAGVTLTTSLEAVPVEVEIDHEDFRRALINVIENAVQAISESGDEGGGHVDVSCRLAGDRVLCEVRDDGPGIPAHALDHVMEPLFSTKSFGTGLGLPTVQRIMEEHGGGVRIESGTGRGTVVQLWLPLRGNRVGDGGNGQPQDTDRR